MHPPVTLACLMITGSNHTHMRAHKQARARYCSARKQTHLSPTCSPSPLAFLFRKEDKYPHNRKKPAPDAFSTVHCFNYMYLLTSLDLFSADCSLICFEWIMKRSLLLLWQYFNALHASTPGNELYACE